MSEFSEKFDRIVFLISKVSKYIQNRMHFALSMQYFDKKDLQDVDLRPTVISFYDRTMELFQILSEWLKMGYDI